jgi:DNA-binding LytR/AlgR family response regulator
LDPHAHCFYISTPAGPLAITAPDIEAIIATENYVEVCTSDGRHYLHRATLQSVGDTLRTPTIFRVRRSAIVNLDHVRARMPDWQLRLTSGRIVRVGRTYRTQYESATTH